MAAGREEQEEGQHEKSDGYRKEAVAMGIVEVGEEIASQKSSAAEEGENDGDPVIGKMSYLQEEWFDIAIGGEVSRRNKQAEEE